MLAPVTERVEREPRKMLQARGPSGSILIADLPPLNIPSTPTRSVPHARLYYFATLLVFLFLYLSIAVEAFIVTGRWIKMWPPTTGPVCPVDLKPHAWPTGCSLIRLAPLT